MQLLNGLDSSTKVALDFEDKSIRWYFQLLGETTDTCPLFLNQKK